VELPQKIRVISLSAMSLEVLRRAFELAGIEFIDENGDGAGAGSASVSGQN
jgi:hypothetical protein